MDILVVDKFYLLLQGERCDDGGGLEAQNPDLRQAENGVSARHSVVECVENSTGRVRCGQPIRHLCYAGQKILIR